MGKEKWYNPSKIIKMINLDQLYEDGEKVWRIQTIINKIISDTNENKNLQANLIDVHTAILEIDKSIELAKADGENESGLYSVKQILLELKSAIVKKIGTPNA